MFGQLGGWGTCFWGAKYPTDCFLQTLASVAAPGVSAGQLAHGSLVELCKRAVDENGAALGEGEIRDLISRRPTPAGEPAQAGQACRTLVMGFRGNDGSLSRVSLAACPIGPQDAADRPGAVIFLQKESN